MDKTEYTTIALAMSKNNSNNILRHTIPYTYHKKGVPEKWGYPLNSPLQGYFPVRHHGFWAPQCSEIPIYVNPCQYLWVSDTSSFQSRSWAWVTPSLVTSFKSLAFQFATTPMTSSRKASLLPRGFV